MERYGISEEDSNGTVLWHSLNENGEIGVYDMKFGNTIIRNLTEADLVEKKKKKLRTACFSLKPATLTLVIYADSTKTGL